MSKVKIGIVGTGSISRSHMDSYKKNPNAEIYALCDIHEGRLREAGEQYGISRLYTDINEMLALPELDAVSVTTWNSAHAECAIAALNAGKHVLCEKPMATSVEDALRMKEAAEKNGKLLMIGFVRRFGDDMKLIEDMRDKDCLGELYYAKATYIRRNGCPMGWFGEKSRSGGGPLIDLGVHVIDFVRYAFGNPKPISVYAATFNKIGSREELKTRKGYYAASATGNDIFDVEDLATALIRFEGGAVLQIEASFSLHTHNEGKIRLFGSKAGVEVDTPMKLLSEMNGYMTDVTLVDTKGFDFGKSFAEETDHFIDCIINGTKCKNPAEDGVELMKILCAAYESAATGHEVIID